MQAAALLIFRAKGSRGTSEQGGERRLRLFSLLPCRSRSIITYYNRWGTHQPQAETRQEPILALNPAGIALRIGA